VCDVIIDYSYAFGRPHAYFGRDKVIAEITRISKGNISTILAELAVRNVIIVDRRGGRYIFQPDFSRWAYRSIFPSEAHARAADRIEMWLAEAARCEPEQLHLLEPPPDLDAIMAGEARVELSRSASPAAQSGTTREGSTALTPLGDRSAHTDISVRIAQSLAESEMWDAPRDSDPRASGNPVPFTGAGSISGSQFGNSVPIPGTHHIDASKCEAIASHINVTECRVPNSGTALLKPKPETERELLALIAQYCGKDCVDHWGGFWRKQIRANTVQVREAISDLRLRLADQHQRAVRNRGSWLRDRYDRLTGKKPSNT
jgi:hypothetical protein